VCTTIIYDDIFMYFNKSYCIKKKKKKKNKQTNKSKLKMTEDETAQAKQSKQCIE